MGNTSVVGATGLVGRRILEELADRRRSAKAWIRRHTELPAGIEPFPSQVIPSSLDPFWRCDTLFVALGTTIAKAKSREAFEAVDRGLVVECARRARAAGCGTIALVSAAGADPRSRVFYSRVKGLAEQDVATLGFHRVVVARPSLLLGEREEFRAGELVARKCLGALRRLLPRAIRPVEDREVARALVGSALDESWSGVRILGNRDLLQRGPRPQR